MNAQIKNEVARIVREVETEKRDGIVVPAGWAITLADDGKIARIDNKRGVCIYDGAEVWEAKP